MLVKTAAIEVAPPTLRAVVVALHPGTVNPRPCRPFQWRRNSRPVVDAAGDMLRALIACAQETGSFTPTKWRATPPVSLARCYGFDNCLLTSSTLAALCSKACHATVHARPRTANTQNAACIQPRRPDTILLPPTPRPPQPSVAPVGRTPLRAACAAVPLIRRSPSRDNYAVRTTDGSRYVARLCAIDLVACLMDLSWRC